HGAATPKPLHNKPPARRHPCRIVRIFAASNGRRSFHRSSQFDNSPRRSACRPRHRRLGSPGPGRRPDSPIKKFAVASRLIELAAKYPDSAYGVKKQMYGDLETKFGLKRSQLSKLINGFNPWEFIRNKAPGKSD